MKILVTVAVTALAGATAALAQDAAVPSRLTLRDALRLAEERSPAVAGARALVGVAEADVVGAKQRPTPLLSFTSEGYAFGAGQSHPFIDAQELVVRFDQEIETAGRRGLRVETAARSVDAARASVAEQVRLLQLDVERAYFQAVLARADADAAKTSLTEMDKVIEVSRTRYRLGELSGGELRRLEVERLKFVDDVFAADLALRNARSLLLTLMNAGRLDVPIEPVEPWAPPGGIGPAGAIPLPLDAAALTAQALANRPDLLTARREQERADSEARLQHAIRTPNVTAGAGYRREFGENGLVVALSVPLPIFGRNPGGVARADAERRLAASRIAVAESAVALQVQQALNNVEVSRARVDYLEREFLKSARESRDIVLAAYRGGAADLSDYLDAERALREGQRAYNRALFDHRMHLFELDAAVGRPAGD
jgi:cobalt-zinc-cadmium efflux system outer membrane protein